MPFYDEFVEKQLLAGNISSRHITVTLLSVNLTIPAADHIHAGTLPHSTTSRSEDPSLKLQSIPEKVGENVLNIRDDAQAFYLVQHGWCMLLTRRLTPLWFQRLMQSP